MSVDRCTVRVLHNFCLSETQRKLWISPQAMKMTAAPLSDLLEQEFLGFQVAFPSSISSWSVWGRCGQILKHRQGISHWDWETRGRVPEEGSSHLPSGLCLKLLTQLPGLHSSSPNSSPIQRGGHTLRLFPAHKVNSFSKLLPGRKISLLKL